MRVMVVDDDKLISDLISICLSHHGFEVCAPASAAAALTEIARSPPDILLLDIRMPGLDGLSVLKTLRDCAVGGDMRVLMLTGEDDLHFVCTAQQLGACGYLVKPFVPDRLVATVRKMLDDPEMKWIDDHHVVTYGRGTGAMSAGAQISRAYAI